MMLIFYFLLTYLLTPSKVKREHMIFVLPSVQGILHRASASSLTKTCKDSPCPVPKDAECRNFLRKVLQKNNGDVEL